MSDFKNRTVVSILKPFADYADPHRKVPREMVITNGSPMAKRQLTMGDCYDAKDAIDVIENNAGANHVRN